METPPPKAWNRVPQSKNSTRGYLPTGFRILSFSAYQTMYFHKVSCFYRDLQLIYGKPPSKAWNRVPQSKYSTRGNVPTGFRILSFSAYQTMYFHKVSCFYRHLHLIYGKPPSKAWNRVPQSKNSTRRHCRIRYASYVFQRIKLCILTKFRAFILFCKIFLSTSLTKVPIVEENLQSCWCQNREPKSRNMNPRKYNYLLYISVFFQISNDYNTTNTLLRTLYLF